MKKITTCLWFDGQAEDAAGFYTGLFEGSKVLDIKYFPEAGNEVHGQSAGSVMTVDFEMDGKIYTALNGGPHFKFNEAVSFVLHCKDQEEIDYYWEKLSHFPESEQCGWCKDRFGLSWQIIPIQINEWLQDANKREAVMAAILTMKKIDLKVLESV